MNCGELKRIFAVHSADPAREPRRCLCNNYSVAHLLKTKILNYSTNNTKYIFSVVNIRSRLYESFNLPNVFYGIFHFIFVEIRLNFVKIVSIRRNRITDCVTWSYDLRLFTLFYRFTYDF